MPIFERGYNHAEAENKRKWYDHYMSLGCGTTKAWKVAGNKCHKTFNASKEKK